MSDKKCCKENVGFLGNNLGFVVFLILILLILGVN